MYVVRLPNRDGKLHLALTAERDVKANHPEINRTKRIIGEEHGFPMREVEGTGKYRRDVVDLTLGRDTSENEHGRPPYQRQLRVPLSAVSEHVRRLPNDACEPLALNAQEIERAKAEVHRLRKERAELVRSAWRKSRRTVGASELEAAVERTSKIKEQPARALVLTDREREQLKRDQETLNAFAAKVLGGM